MFQLFSIMLEQININVCMQKYQERSCVKRASVSMKKVKSPFLPRIADKKQQAGERIGISGHTQIKGKGDER